MVEIYDPEWIWIVVVGFLLAFILCLGIGANDVANTFGTSVGSKVLTLRQACILATIFETAGAVLLGAKVSETVRKGIIDVSLYENSTEEFLLGNVAALGGSALWLIIATAFKVPVSTTHSIVGATVGFALVVNGAKGVDWVGLGKIVASWFISPVLSGLVTVLVFLFCDRFILRKAKPLEHGLSWLPFFYAFTITINVFSIFYEGPEFFYFDRIPLWGVFLISFGTGLISALVVRFVVVPRQRRSIISECTEFYENEKHQITSGTTGMEPTTFTTTTSTNALIANNESSVSLKSYTNEGFKSDKSISPSKVVPAAPVTFGIGTPLYENLGVTFGIGTPLYENLGVTADPVTSPAVNASTSGALNGAANGLASGSAVSPMPNGSGSINGDLKDVDNVNLDVPKDEEQKIVVKDGPEAARLFSFLQILTAVFGAFAHGGNDVSNGIGPLISIWLVAISGEVETEALTPLWILLYGGMGISIGLWIWGRGVIETMGTNLTTVTPSSGFSIEIGAALTVLVASNVGIPVSSTHCKVGSVVSVGRIRSKDNVDWKLFRNIIFSWVVTLPATMAFSAALMALLLLTV